jgi:predicted transglutaminase-like cysteine proteinase
VARRQHDNSGPALQRAFRCCIFWLVVTAGSAQSDPGGLQDGDGARRVLQWERLIEEGRMLSGPERLAAVNDFFNSRLAFVDDRWTWGVDDYWATPLEALVRGGGDCEDFSIAKYVTLRRMGEPIDRLRLTYVRADLGMLGGGAAQAHMVLAYYPEPRADPLVLDNLVADIRPASQRPDLQPVFSFNSEGLWLGGVKASAGPAVRLSRWRNVLARMSSEGVY